MKHYYHDYGVGELEMPFFKTRPRTLQFDVVLVCYNVKL